MCFVKWLQSFFVISRFLLRKKPELLLFTLQIDYPDVQRIPVVHHSATSSINSTGNSVGSKSSPSIYHKKLQSLNINSDQTDHQAKGQIHPINLPRVPSPAPSSHVGLTTVNISGDPSKNKMNEYHQVIISFFLQIGVIIILWSFRNRPNGMYQLMLQHPLVNQLFNNEQHLLDHICCKCN